jgi:hypothetical protein
MRYNHHKNKLTRLLLLPLIICFLCGLITFPASVSFASKPDINVLPGDILFQEDFEDGDITAADPGLTNGMTWTSGGSIGSGKRDNYGNNISMDAGAYIRL